MTGFTGSADDESTVTVPRTPTTVCTQSGTRETPALATHG
jgi:hypothetical protein